jgi:putative membrane protein
MRKLTSVILLAATAITIQSCSGVRSAAGPGGPVIPSSGDASSVSAGRNVTGAPVGTDATTSTAVNAESTADKDSLANKVYAVDKHNKPMQFILQAAISGNSRVQSSELAAVKAQNSYVKAFSAMVLKDDAAAIAELKTLGSGKSLTTDTLGQGANAVVATQLNAASAQDFDNLYIQLMVDDHKKAVELFKEGTKSKDEAVKAYAEKYLPLLESHLSNISALKAK